MVVDPLASRGIEVAAPSADDLWQIRCGRHRASRERGSSTSRSPGPRYDVMKSRPSTSSPAAPEFDLVVVGGRLIRTVSSRTCRAADYRTAPRRRRRDHAPLAVFLVPEAPQARLALGQGRYRQFLYAGSLRRCGRGRALPPPRRGSRFHRAGLPSRGWRRAARSTRWDFLPVLDRLGIPRAPAVAFDIDAAPCRAALRLSGRRQGAVRADCPQIGRRRGDAEHRAMPMRSHRHRDVTPTAAADRACWSSR